MGGRLRANDEARLGRDGGWRGRRVEVLELKIEVGLEGWKGGDQQLVDFSKVVLKKTMARWITWMDEAAVGSARRASINTAS